MHKRLRLTLVALAAASLSCAHADDLQNVMRALGTAIQGQIQQGSKASSVSGAPADGLSPTTAGFNHVGRNVDTPENLELLKLRLAERLHRMGPSASPMELMGACRAEMGPLSAYQAVGGGGYDELMRKCETEQRAAMVQAQARREQSARNQREASEVARAEREVAEKRQEEEQIRVLTAELRAGTRQPENCAQWMLVKGQDPQKLNAKVTEISFQPPQGIGSFAGSVEQITGGTLLLEHQPLFRSPGDQKKFYIVNVTNDTKIFGGDRIKVGSVIGGFATQSATRNLRMTDGSAHQSPVLQVTCAQPVL